MSLLQAEMAAAAAAAALSIEERDEIIAGLRASLAEYVIELKALTDIKLALDAEITTYRRLLAGEESRSGERERERYERDERERERDER